MMRIFCSVMVLLSVATAPAFGANWITAKDYDAVTVVAKPSQGVEEKAVREFVTYWERATGQRPTVRETPGDGVNVWIGASVLPEEWKKTLALDSLGFDGILLRTMPADMGKNLVLAGGPGKGTLFAVYEFLERAFDIRWLAPGVVDIPTAPKRIAAMDYRFTPRFVYRDAGLPRGADKDLYRHNSPYVYGLRGHSFYDILPPDKYFAEHPEYYAEINGKRIAGAGINWEDVRVAQARVREIGQLCMTNPEVAEAIVRELKGFIAENPKANLWSVSQMDWGNNCTCPTCKEIDEREGTPAASLLVGVNRVAELIEKDYPGFAIQTYAYTYTRKPPKTIRPRHNVIVQLCSIECDFARPFNDPQAGANRSFVEDLKGWSALGTNLFFYDYPINCLYAIRPYPYEEVMAKNLAFMADNGTIGAFEQSHTGESTSFGAMKAYVISKLLWNPADDPEALVREFMFRYYGKSAPYLWKFYVRCQETLREKDVQMFLFDTCGWIDRKLVEDGEALFKKAFAAAESDEIRKRVELAHYQVLCAAQLARPDYTFEKDRVLIERPPLLTRAEMTTRAEELGILADIPRDWPSFEDMIEPFPVTPVPAVTSSPLAWLENDRYLVWMAPEMKGSILRMRDKKLGVDLLKGYETYDTSPGAYQEWSAIGDMGEGVAAKKYELVRKDEHEATIRATTKNGLRIERTVRVAPGSDKVEVRLLIANDTDKPQPVSVKIHPEFYCQRALTLPELWVKAATGWERVKEDSAADSSVGAKVLPPAPGGVWGAYVPESDITLLNEYQPGQLENLIFYYNTGKGSEQINLELMPTRKMLQPGEQHVVETSYVVVKGRPADAK